MQNQSIDNSIPCQVKSYIYALIDPFTEEIRYIGKTIRPQERLSNHCNEPPYCHRTKWIQSVIRKGGRPTMDILEEVEPNASWQEAERKWISYGKDQGWRLTNGTDGGDGVPNLSGEGKERMLQTWRGRKHKPESIIKIGDASRGRRHTEEYKEYMRKIMSVRVFTDQHRKNLSESRKGKFAKCKITVDMARDIVLRFKSEKAKDLAEEFGVTTRTIWTITSGRWRPNTVGNELNQPEEIPDDYFPKEVPDSEHGLHSIHDEDA